MLEELKGKTALVTGASRGIGAATAVALARAGVSRIVIHYGGYLEGAEQTRALAEGAGANTDVLKGDLGTPHGIHQFIADLKQTSPEVGILINNAGFLVKRAKLAEYTEELYDITVECPRTPPFVDYCSIIPNALTIRSKCIPSPRHVCTPATHHGCRR